MIRIKHKSIKRSSGQISRKVSREWKQQSNNTNRSVDANDTRTISTNWWAGRGRIYPTEFVSPSRPICHASPQRFHVYAITLPPYIHTYVCTPLLQLLYFLHFFPSFPPTSFHPSLYLPFNPHPKKSNSVYFKASCEANGEEAARRKTPRDEGEKTRRRQKGSFLSG